MIILINLFFKNVFTCNNYFFNNMNNGKMRRPQDRL